MVWLHNEFMNLHNNADNLSDKEFLKEFEIIKETFEGRKEYLTECANVVKELYSSPLKVFEPASGIGIFSEIMNRLGYDSIGLEPENCITYRYCKLKNIPILKCYRWYSEWELENKEFDLIVIISYHDHDKANELWDNLHNYIEKGTKIIFFDLRQVDYFKEKIIECKTITYKEISAMNKPFGNKIVVFEKI